MATNSLQIQIAAKRAAEAQKRALEEAGISSGAPRETSDEFTPKTFVHLTAGATTILPDGRRISFLGPKNGNGEYTAKNWDELEWLEELAASATSQVSALPDNQTVKEAAAKLIDPVMVQAAVDAATNSAHAADPKLTALTENLGAVIAKSQ